MIIICMIIVVLFVITTIIDVINTAGSALGVPFIGEVHSRGRYFREVPRHLYEGSGI